MRRVPLIVAPDPDDPDCAAVMVDGTIAGRPYRFILDTGAARTQVEADKYTAALSSVAGDNSSGVFASHTNPIVTITNLVVGPLQAATLEVTRAEPAPRRTRNLLGMDVLRRYCCLFRLDASVLDLGTPPGRQSENDLQMDSRGHFYVDVSWPGVIGHACWDSGAGITVVNRDFWLEHPDLFEQIGTSVGTDDTGAQAETPTMLMAESVISQRSFGRHKVAVVDLSHINGSLEQPMDLILGYPTLRQADWLFDFPARRWTLM